MSQPDNTQVQQICDLAMKLVEVGRAGEADLSTLFNALAMAYLSVYIATKVSQGDDVEEPDIIFAIEQFSECLKHQAYFLLNFHPHVLKNENSLSQGET